jgi:hypothetical protein
METKVGHTIQRLLTLRQREKERERERDIRKWEQKRGRARERERERLLLCTHIHTLCLPIHPHLHSHYRPWRLLFFLFLPNFSARTNTFAFSFLPLIHSHDRPCCLLSCLLSSNPHHTHTLSKNEVFLSDLSLTLAAEWFRCLRQNFSSLKNLVFFP